MNKKLLAALRHDLKPIVCVGETLEQKDAGKTLDVVRSQVRNGLAGISGGAVREITIAYEPVWAIGTGRNATPQEAEDVHNGLRELFFEMFDIESARDLRVIYGGSVKPENIDGLMAQPNIDGALVGGASLDAAQFAHIVRFKPRRRRWAPPQIIFPEKTHTPPLRNNIPAFPCFFHAKSKI